MSESQNIEWKQSWKDDYLKWVCGFANAEGGRIYIGKNDDGSVHHLSDYRELMESIPSKIRDRLGIVCPVNLMEERGSKFIEIAVPPLDVALSLRGRFYFRSGSSKVELSGSSLTEFLLKKSGKTWDDVAEPFVSLDEIDEGSMQRYLKDAQKVGRMPKDEGLSTLEVLDKLRLISKGNLKRAALVLFGKDPGRFYPNLKVKIGRFGKDSADLKYHEVLEGNLIQLLYEVLNVLSSKFLVRKIDFQGIYRIEKGEYPVEALREMLLNALVHRRYLGSAVQIRVFDDRISIWNEGNLPLGLTVTELKQSHNSRPRNPLIADACFRGGYIDTWGRGTLKILESCKIAGLPEPELLEKEGGMQVVLFKPPTPKRGGVIGGLMGGVMGGVIGGAIDGLTERQLRILALIKSNPEVSYQMLAEAMDINKSAVGKHVSTLKAKGFLQRKGGTRGYWKVLKSSPKGKLGHSK